MSAAAAEDGARVELTLRPDFRRVSGKFGVAFETRKPSAAAFELDRDDIAFAVVVSAPRFSINLDAGDVHVVNLQLDALTLLHARAGISSTRSDAITQHTLMKTNPTSNDPVR